MEAKARYMFECAGGSTNLKNDSEQYPKIENHGDCKQKKKRIKRRIIQNFEFLMLFNNNNLCHEATRGCKWPHYMRTIRYDCICPVSSNFTTTYLKQFLQQRYQERFKITN